ncbi:TonB-dependent receptor [Kerstersia similis]
MAHPFSRRPFKAGSQPSARGSSRSIPVSVCCLALLLSLGDGMLARPVQAQDSMRPGAHVPGRIYDIPAGSLGEVLSTFAGQSGINISFHPEQTAGLQGAAMRGSYTVEQGLSFLLRDTPLEAVRQGKDVYHLQLRPRLDTSASVTALDAVQVYGQESAKDLAYLAPQSVNVLTRDEIEQFRGTSVGDIFQGIPGVLIGENRNSGGLDVNIRGMQGQGRVPVLVDGARQETTVYRGYSGVASRSYIDPDLIGGITIEKGPSMTAQGTGAVGGLVIARTLSTSDIVKDGQTFGVRMRGSVIGNNSGSPVAPGTTSGYYPGREYRINCKPGSEAQCSAGYDPASMVGPSGDTTLERPATLEPKSWASSLAMGLQLGKVELVAAYATRRQGNYYAGKHGPAPVVDMSNTAPGLFDLWTSVYPVMTGASRFRAGELVVNSNYKSQSSLLKAKAHLAPDQELELGWLRYKSEYGELMPSQLIWLGHIAQTNNSEVTANTYTSRYKWSPADNSLLNVSANLWHTDTDTLNRNYGAIKPDAGMISAFSSAAAENYRRTGADLSNTMLFDFWGEAELRYGVAVQREDVKPTGGDPDAFNNARDAERKEYSTFIALKYQPLPSVTLDAGLRYTRYHALDHKTSSICETETVESDAGNGGPASVSSTTTCETVMIGKVRHSGSAPVASLSWEFAPGWQVYGRYAEALRMPSLFESSSGFSVNTVVGSYLKPEHARNREVGISLLQDGVFTNSDALRLKFSYFRNHMSDYLTRTVSNADESGEWRMRNIDSARFNGFEVSGSYDAGMFFAEFGATRYNLIEICHSGSYRRQRCTDFGLAVSYVNNMIPPNWHGSARLGLRLLDRRLVLGMRGTFMGERNRVPEYDDQHVNSIFAKPVEWHKYKIFDLFASYRINDAISVDFNIDNLTDRYYLDAIGLGAVPAPGRTARLGMTLQF